MDYAFLTDTALFRGTAPGEAEIILGCLGAFSRQYAKGAAIFRAGDCTGSMGLVLSGVVDIEIVDLWGNRTLLERAVAGELFAETYACIPGEPMMVSVTAGEKSDILFLSAERLLTTCPNSCAHHSRLIQNMLSIFAQKNLALSRRSLHTSPKTIRGRLLSYLSQESRQAGAGRFTIPLNRQQLADYLGVDRSALSNELSKMRRERIIGYERNNFTLLF